MQFRFIGDDITSFPSTGIGEIVETTYDWYLHFRILSQNKPLHEFKQGYVCGDVYTNLPQMDEHGHVTKGHPVHRLFYRHDGRYFTVALPIRTDEKDLDALVGGIILLMHNQPSTL